MIANGERSIGDRLRLARLERRLLQRAVARDAGLSPSTVSLIENGWRDPQPEEIIAIARAIGLDPVELEP
jgi:transcriptional regulator with XRE-family HTH domain